MLNSVVAITSGANMNFDKLRLVADRAGSGTKEEVLRRERGGRRVGESWCERDSARARAHTHTHTHTHIHTHTHTHTQAMLASSMPEKKGEFQKFINILSGAGLARGSGGCVLFVVLFVPLFCTPQC